MSENLNVGSLKNHNTLAHDSYPGTRTKNGRCKALYSRNPQETYIYTVPMLGVRLGHPQHRSKSRYDIL